MKEQRDVIITTGTPEANRSVDSLLKSVGIDWRGRQPSVGEYDHTHSRISSKEGTICRPLHDAGHYFEKARSGESRMFHHTELTLELVATFPGAKQLPPTGPWELEGRMWEIGGEKKNRFKRGEAYLDRNGNVYIEELPTFVYSYEFWPLRPLITAELQAAMDLEAESKKYVTEANRLARHYKDLAKNTNITHKANIARVEALKLSPPSPNK